MQVEQDVYIHFFRGLPPLVACSPSKGPPSHRTILAAALSPRDTHQARMLGCFLSRVLYTRELYVACLAGLPAATHRPDHLLCSRLACCDQVDPTDRFLASTAVHSWLGTDLPPPVVLTIPESGHVYLA